MICGEEVDVHDATRLAKSRIKIKEMPILDDAAIGPPGIFSSRPRSQ
jgi:hypothetical protein